MKKDNAIPANARLLISHFAQLLEKSMDAAAKTDRSIRPVGWRYIKNQLPKWSLWPVESIKIS
jgi:hypothetical protein